MAFNHERSKYLSIGTLSGVVYEKGNATILLLPEPSLTISQVELGLLEANGAETLRFVTREKITFAISLSDFNKRKQAYYSRLYGPQWRVPITHFESVAKTKRRNARMDAPKPQTPGYQRPVQKSLFDMPAFDQNGNFHS